MDQHDAPVETPAARFADTRWTLVSTALRGDADRVRRALLELCLQYWYPVYTYLRSCGHPPTVAEDIAAAFFEDLLHSRLRLSRAPAHSRFRDFLLDALHRFLAADWRDAAAQSTLATPLPSPPGEDLEARHQCESVPQTPAHAFQRSYALELISNAHRRLHREAVDAGRGPMFDALAPYLAAQPEAGRYEAIARQLSTRPLILAIALKRLRQRFQELVQEELAETVSDDAELARERAELLALLQ